MVLKRNPSVGEGVQNFLELNNAGQLSKGHIVPVDFSVTYWF